MLNSKGQRELAYLVKIDDIQPITGSDNCECAVVGGWHIMVKKNTFNIGDPAIYFEIDSLVDTTKEVFSFMERYHGRVKTQKYTFGGKGSFISQGLLMHPSDFGWTIGESFVDGCVAVIDNGKYYNTSNDSKFFTDLLGVRYYDPEDEKRKKDTKPKQPAMPKFFYHGIGRKMMRIGWLRKILIKLFGKKKKNISWPYWVVKTDEERVQNIPWIIKEEDYWIATEKIDGTSTTFTVIRNKKKYDFYVCSRNIVFDNSNKDQCYYNSNVYLEMAEKYPIKDFLISYLNDHKDIEWVTLQGETYGGSIQKRDYSTKEHDFKAFNFIDSKNGRWNSVNAKAWLENNGIPFVPIIDTHFVMPETVDELLLIAEGNSAVDGLPREGIVFRSADGHKSFKAVSNSYLLKYHGG